jgi:hypothetical protein
LIKNKTDHLSGIKDCLALEPMESLHRFNQIEPILCENPKTSVEVAPLRQARFELLT